MNGYSFALFISLEIIIAHNCENLKPYSQKRTEISMQTVSINSKKRPSWIDDRFFACPVSAFTHWSILSLWAKTLVISGFFKNSVISFSVLRAKYRCQKRCTQENPRFPRVFFVFLVFPRYFKNWITMRLKGCNPRFSIVEAVFFPKRMKRSCVMSL